MLRKMFLILMLCFASCNSDAAEGSLAQKCRALFDDPKFDCICATNFIEPRFSGAEAKLLLKVWAFNEDQVRYKASERDLLYARHGSSALNRVLYRFNLVRYELFLQCPSVWPDWDYGF